MRIDRLPIAVFVLTFVGVSLSLWLGRLFDMTPDCRVFIDGCTSISASARQEPAVFVFRGTIIPVGMILILVWWLTANWLKQLGAGNRVSRFFIHLLGTASPILLIAYIALIGSEGEIDHAIRQIVITTYFPATLVAKMITAVCLLRLNPVPVPRWLAVTMLVSAIAVFLVAVSSIILAQLMDDPSRAHNILQWNATTVFAAWYLLLWLAWRHTGLTMTLAADRQRPG